MPIISNNHNTLPLELKTMEVSKVKNRDKNIFWEREFLASQTENNLSRKLYDEWSGFIGIRPTKDFWSPVDLICYNDELNIKFFVELKNRNVEHVYDTLMIGKSKIFKIVAEELYPTYIVNQFREKYYVYEILDDNFLVEANKTKDDRNFYIPKTICFSLEEFISRVRGVVRLGLQQQQLMPNVIIP